MSDFNICGVVVHTQPQDMQDVQARLIEIPGVEIHGHNTDGRLVVTVEDTPQQACIDTLGAMHRIDGVLSASLSYQHGEDSAAEA